MRKKLIAIIFGLLVFSLVSASAASLGGVSTSDLGAEAAVVASCDTDGVTVDYTTTYVPGAPGNFEVASVVVTAIDPACDGFDIDIAVGDGSSELGNGSDVVASGAATVAISTGVDAAAVTEVGVVISN